MRWSSGSGRPRERGVAKSSRQRPGEANFPNCQNPGHSVAEMTCTTSEDLTTRNRQLRGRILGLQDASSTGRQAISWGGDTSSRDSVRPREVDPRRVGRRINEPRPKPFGQCIPVRKSSERLSCTGLVRQDAAYLAERVRVRLLGARLRDPFGLLLFAQRLSSATRV